MSQEQISTNNKLPSKLLAEVACIRPILILLLIVYHAFLIYAGGWREPAGFESNEAYGWIARFSYSFMLEMFVFVSGYVWAYQIERGKKFTFLHLVKDKAIRLLLPCFIFSTIYWFLLRPTPPQCIVVQIVNGVGHMWFLPMLFLCFIGCYLINRIKLGIHYIVITLALLALISYLPLPSRIENAMYYMFFFYAGYALREHRWDEKLRVNIHVIGVSWGVYIILFVCGTFCKELLDDSANHLPLLMKALCLSVGKLCQLIYASAGILAMFMLSLYITDRHQLPQWLIKCGTLCFGVYLFQQFILQLLYYRTNIPIEVGAMWLPWIGTIIALILSILLTLLVRKTSVGRKLM